MIGILVVTHGNAGKELIKSSELIIGSQEKLEGLSLNHGDDINELEKQVEMKVKELDDGKGVLVMVDLLGGSPCNVTGKNIKRFENIECLTGVNLSCYGFISSRNKRFKKFDVQLICFYLHCNYSFEKRKRRV